MEVQKPKVVPPLDKDFVPAALYKKSYNKLLNKSETFLIAVERQNGVISRKDLKILPENVEYLSTLTLVERTIKFLLWSYGGFRIHLCGSQKLIDEIKRIYSKNGKRSFDVELMEKVYERKFEVISTPSEIFPEPNASGKKIGGFLNGCRIGFDLGASDFKLAAVKDGEPVFSTEIPWDPVVQSDPEYHYNKIKEGLKLAASHLSRVDAIGGSSAGIIVDNRVMLASLFRSVKEFDFENKVKPIFYNLTKEWNVKPIVINDGDVTALAGALSFKENAILGVAMGSSEATGFINSDGVITGQLNELAFAPVDYNMNATSDEWSGDVGVGALYFSQQAVNKLAPKVGYSFNQEVKLPERLKIIQNRANNGDKDALKIFETIGIYLGYTIPHYLDYYDFKNILILGRVTSGRGGEVILDFAKQVLQKEFPELSIRIVVPDEKMRRVGQAFAAATLPPL